jgi:patatin-related protein
LNVGSRTEEVRLAMAWNGGVSLAIWMGGAAVELDTARRARLGPQTEKGNERSVYHALADALDRTLVIDILAGASAGGINGALLGAVITNARELRPGFLRNRWLDLGNLSTLLQPTNDTRPPSLMRGNYFRDAIREAFRAVTGEAGDEDKLGKLTKPSQDGLERGEVALDIQSTNVAGAQRGFGDQWNQTLYAHEYRAPIRFRQPEDYKAAELASAARASASFPVAFEPFPLTGKTAGLGGFTGLKRWAVDGGLLENAPIRPAIDLIPTRRSDRLVTRFVCYVNAAPALLEEVDDSPDAPTLGKILGDVVNLPRNGRFIDQLIAIEEAAQRTSAVKDAASGLIDVDLAALRATAEKLLPAYRGQRTAQSLREILTAAGAGSEATARTRTLLDALGTRSLPWIPTQLNAPAQASEWRWGLRAAQRILLLLLDLIQQALDRCSTAEEADAILDYRRPINMALVGLEDAHDRFSSSRRIREAVRALSEAAEAEADDSVIDQRLAELATLMVGYRCEAYDAIRRSAEALHKAFSDPRIDGGVPLEQLFGAKAAKGFTEAGFRTFVERALAMEVVRRAFSSDQALQPVQELHFVQLTPLAPVRIFTPTPLRKTGPDSGREKLTGLDLAHFSAFYRASWRVNDFMWGRLDAATRIVDLLVSAERARNVAARDPAAEPPWSKLAKELAPLGEGVDPEELRQLAKEALDDAAGGGVDFVPAPVAAAASQPGAGGSAAAQLQDRLRGTLEADLTHREGGFLTRVVCQRAAQHEILRQELQPLAEATALDGRLGCFTKAIKLDGNVGSLANARKIVLDDPLPRVLGNRVPDETTSTLAVRTLSHAVLVLISLLKTAGVPLSTAFAPIRAPFLSLAGVTAEKVWNRGAALLAFIAGSMYVTARSVTAKDTGADLNTVWDVSTLAEVVAIFGVVGLAALPLWRAKNASVWPRKIRQGVWGLGLLLSSGLAALLTACIAVGPGNAFTSTDGFALPSWLAWSVVGIPLGAGFVVRRLPVPDFGKKPLASLVTRPGVTALTTTVLAGLLAYQCWGTLSGTASLADWRGLFHPGDWEWRELAVVACYASVPLALVYGLHGFVKAWFDWIRVRRAFGGPPADAE